MVINHVLGLKEYVAGLGGGGALDFHLDGGGVPLGVENLTLSPLGAQKIHPVPIYLYY